MDNSTQNNFFTNDPNTESSIKFDQLIKTILRKKNLVAGITALTFVSSTVITFLVRPIWEGSFQIVLNDNESDPFSSLGAAIINSQPGLKRLIGGQADNKLDTEVKILESSSILKPIYKFAKKSEAELGEDVSDWLYEDWKDDNLKIELEMNTSVLNIKYQSKNKQTIIPVLEKISNKYQEYSKRDRIRGLKKGLIYLDEQINNFTKKTEDSLFLLDDFAQKYNIVPIVSSSKIVEDREPSDLETKIPSPIQSSPIFTTSLEQERVLATKSIEESEYKLEEIKKLFASESNKNISEKIYYFISTIPELEAQGLPSRLVLLENELINLREKFKEDYILIQETIKKRDSTIEILKKQAISFLNAKISEANAIIEKTKRPEGTLTKFKEIYRASIRNNITLNTLESQRSFLALEKAKSDDPWELISTPTILTDPVFPSKLGFMASGLILGAVLGIFAAYYKEKKSEIVYDKNTLSELLPYKLLKTFTCKNISSWQNFVEILIDNVVKKEKTKICAFVPVCNLSNNNLMNKLITLLQNYSKKADVKIEVTNDSSEIKKSSFQILIAQTGLYTHSDLLDFNESINIQNLNVIGIIILDEFN